MCETEEVKEIPVQPAPRLLSHSERTIKAQWCTKELEFKRFNNISFYRICDKISRRYFKS